MSSFQCFFFVSVINSVSTQTAVRSVSFNSITWFPDITCIFLTIKYMINITQYNPLNDHPDIKTILILRPLIWRLDFQFYHIFALSLDN